MTTEQQTDETENDPTILTLDRSAGKLVEPSWTEGNGATLAKAATTWKNDDHASVNEGGEKIQSNPIDLTVTDNNTGVTVQITANATIGLDTTCERFNAYGTKNLLRVALLRSGCTRGTLARDLMAALRDDDVPALCALMGVDEDALAEVDAMMKTMGEETTRVQKGRQQITNLTVA